MEEGNYTFNNDQQQKFCINQHQMSASVIQEAVPQNVSHEAQNSSKMAEINNIQSSIMPECTTTMQEQEYSGTHMQQGEECDESSIQRLSEIVENSCNADVTALIRTAVRKIINMKVEENVTRDVLYSKNEEIFKAQQNLQNKIVAAQEMKENIEMKLQMGINESSVLEEQMIHVGDVVKTLMGYVDNIKIRYSEVVKRSQVVELELIKKKEAYAKYTNELKEKLKTKKQTLEKLKETKAEEQQMYLNMLENCKSAITNRKQEISKLKEEVNYYETQKIEKEASVKIKQERLDETNNEILVKTDQINCFKKNLEQLQMQIVTSKSKNEEKLAELTSMINKANLTLVELKQEKETEYEKLNEIIKSASEIETKITSLENENLELETENEELKAKIEIKKEEYDNIQTVLNEKRLLSISGVKNEEIKINALDKDIILINKNFELNKMERDNLYKEKYDLMISKLELEKKLSENKYTCLKFNYEINLLQNEHEKLKIQLNKEQQKHNDLCIQKENEENLFSRNMEEEERKFALLQDEYSKQLNNLTQQKADLEKETLEKQNNAAVLQMLQNDIVKVKDSVATLQFQKNNLDETIANKKKIRDRLMNKKEYLEKERNRLKTLFCGNSSQSQTSSENITIDIITDDNNKKQIVGILKSPGKPTTPTKKVSFNEIDSTISHGSEDSIEKTAELNEIDKIPTADELFDRIFNNTSSNINVPPEKRFKKA